VHERGGDNKSAGGNEAWGASIYGEGPTIDRNYRSRIESVVAQLRDKFDLAVER
jgi:hypothetical protein